MEVDEEGRPVRKRPMDNSVIVLLGGLGAVAFLALMFMLFHTGTSENKKVFNEVVRLMEDEKDFSAALRYAKANGRPGAADWPRLAEKIEQLEELAALEAVNQRNEEAYAWLRDNVEKVVETSGFRPKDRISDDEAAGRLRTFLETYPGTWPADLILSGDAARDRGEPWITYRRILTERASSEANVDQLIERTASEVRPLVAGRQYGQAIEAWERLRRAQSLFLVPELYQDLSRKVNARLADLQRDAREAWARDLQEIRRLKDIGKVAEARGRLEEMIQTYAVPSLVNEGRAMLEEMR